MNLELEEPKRPDPKQLGLEPMIVKPLSPSLPQAVFSWPEPPWEDSWRNRAEGRSEPLGHLNWPSPTGDS